MMAKSFIPPPAGSSLSVLLALDAEADAAVQAAAAPFPSWSAQPPLRRVLVFFQTPHRRRFARHRRLTRRSRPTRNPHPPRQGHQLPRSRPEARRGARRRRVQDGAPRRQIILPRRLLLRPRQAGGAPLPRRDLRTRPRRRARPTSRPISPSSTSTNTETAPASSPKMAIPRATLPTGSRPAWSGSTSLLRSPWRFTSSVAGSARSSATTASMGLRACASIPLSRRAPAAGRRAFAKDVDTTMPTLG